MLKRVFLFLCSTFVILSSAHGLGNPEPEGDKPFHHDPQHDGKDSAVEFSNEWVVHLEGAKNSADLVALKLGYENLGEVRTTSGNCCKY